MKGKPTQPTPEESPSVKRWKRIRHLIRKKGRKLALPISITLFLFFALTIMERCTTYGPEPLNKLIKNKKQINYFQSIKRPRQEIKLVSSPDYSEYPQNSPKLVIVTIVTNQQEDIDQLCIALKSLIFLRGDIANFLAPILVFHEGNLMSSQLEQIVLSTDRLVAFPHTDFTSFPAGFTPSNEKPIIAKLGGNDWGYHQMLRFYTNTMWRHPALKPYDIVMRIDSDICFKTSNSHLPNFSLHADDNKLVYHAQYVGRENNPEYVEGLYDLAEAFLRENDLKPQNPILWDTISDTWNYYHTLPIIMTRNSVIRKQFLQEKLVQKWHDAVTEGEPFGVYRYRWADSAVHLLTVAMFLSNESFSTNIMTGFFHKDDCDRAEVEYLMDAFKREQEWI